jgi:quercetin dioxygenase-like cupin family protein
MHRIGAMSPALLLAAWISAGGAESRPVYRVIEPSAIKWQPGPAGLPQETKSAVLYGDPAKLALFVTRIWLPAGYHIAPHMHSKPEIMTVISGHVILGIGADGDRAKARRLGPGAFVSMEPNTPHYGFANEDAVVQLSTIGPWTVTFVNPADDPRNQHAHRGAR